MSKQELRNCPFCGGEHLGRIDGVEDSPDFRYVCCYTPNCDAHWSSRNGSFDGWNTRPIEDKLQVENKELTAKCNRLESLIDQLIWAGKDILSSVAYADEVEPTVEKLLDDCNAIPLILWRGLIGKIKEERES